MLMRMPDPRWHDLGPADALQDPPLRQLRIGNSSIALSCQNGVFGAVSGVCNHAGGPLGDGHLDGEFVVCPWHYYKFDRHTGAGEPGFEKDRVPSHRLELRDGHLWIDLQPATPRHRLPHEPHPLTRALDRKPGPLRVLGISTTAMDPAHPRYSTSDALLQTALAHARDQLGAETKRIALHELAFRNCEGFYSKAARACTWPCSITQADPNDQMDRVYDGVVFWADVILVATPIRWGSASALYYKMAERMNCIQNQITTHNRVLLRQKVAAFVVTGGQDNIQAVVGQMLTFFGELGCRFPQFPFIAHSRGWAAEDMERNVAIVQHSQELHDGARQLVERAAMLSRTLLDAAGAAGGVARGGRKACRERGDAPEEGPAG
jgi:multimeric flavodoxin WrbA/nitrite reductase/ring-hydroxylating ferredoxin subunit